MLPGCGFWSGRGGGLSAAPVPVPRDLGSRIRPGCRIRHPQTAAAPPLGPGRWNIDPAPTQCQELKWPRGAGFPGSAAGQGPHRGRERRRGTARVPACCSRAPAAGLQRDGIPLCPAMPRSYIEAFRALIMIVASSGRYLAVSGHDHETARAEGPSLSSWQWAGTGPMFHGCGSFRVRGLAAAAGRGPGSSRQPRQPRPSP